jgi:hypothetical protein
MIVASETSPNVSVSVSTPAGKLRSVIGHRNINRPIESPPIRLVCDACIRSAPTKQTRRRRISSNIAVSELQGLCAEPVRHGRYPRSCSRGFLLAAKTIAATHSSNSAYSLASVV